jgi:translation initiation factor IF-2
MPSRAESRAVPPRAGRASRPPGRASARGRARRGRAGASAPWGGGPSWARHDHAPWRARQAHRARPPRPDRAEPRGRAPRPGPEPPCRAWWTPWPRHGHTRARGEGRRSRRAKEEEGRGGGRGGRGGSPRARAQAGGGFFPGDGELGGEDGSSGERERGVLGRGRLTGGPTREAAVLIARALGAACEGGRLGREASWATPAGPHEAHSGEGRGKAGWAARPTGPRARGGGAGLKGEEGGRREKKRKGFPLLKSISR